MNREIAFTNYLTAPASVTRPPYVNLIAKEALLSRKYTKSATPVEVYSALFAFDFGDVQVLVPTKLLDVFSYHFDVEDQHRGYFVPNDNKLIARDDVLYFLKRRLSDKARIKMMIERDIEIGKSNKPQSDGEVGSGRE